ncbi:hypothetical protein BpHYR1_018813, partial [Brachionus plicatilis]
MDFKEITQFDLLERKKKSFFQASSEWRRLRFSSHDRNMIKNEPQLMKCFRFRGFIEPLIFCLSYCYEKLKITK